MARHEWILKRNCSLTPRQVGLWFAALCLVSFAVAGIFAVLAGAWCILAYAALEMLVTALALISYARHATDREHIALTDDGLLVGRVVAGQLRQTRLDPGWTHVALPRSTRDLIGLEARGIRVQVGSFVPAARRRQVAQELRQALAAPMQP